MLDPCGGDEIDQVAVAAHQGEHVVGIGIDVDFLHPAVLLAAQRREDVGRRTAVALGVVVGIADVDRQVAVGVGMGGGLAQGVGGEEFDAGLGVSRCSGRD